MSSSDAPAWELSKENAAPLARGRNVKQLEKSLTKPVESEEDRIEKDRLKHHFERMIVKDNEDPLIPWLSYIKFHQDAYPSDTHSIFLIMERCTRALYDKEKYKNDVRFIRVCVLYAERTSFPGDVFKFLHQHKIGSKVALFWIAWAWVAETRADYAFAEKVFMKGIQKEAAPLKILKQRHKQFQRRMSRHWLNESQKDFAEEEIEENVGRSALGGLSEKRVRRNDRRQNGNHSRNRSTFTSRAPNTTSTSNNSVGNKENTTSKGGGFSIFVDENENNDDYDLNQSHAEPDQRELESEAHRTKENTLKAERWNRRGGYSSRHGDTGGSRCSMSRPPSFEIHVDNECAAQNKNNLNRTKSQFEKGGRALQRRDKEDVAEKLARDPTRYLVNPEKLKKDTKMREIPVASTANEGGRRLSSKDNVKKAELSCGFDKSLLAKDKNGHDCCFEEQRAKGECYTILTADTNFNNFKIKKERSYIENEDGESIESVNMDETDHGTVASKQSMTSSTCKARRVLFSMNVSFDRNNQIMLNTSTTSSTINDGVGLTLSKEEETINTKFAMKELSMMFSSPALGSVEDGNLSHIQAPQQSNDANETASYSVVAGLIGDDAQYGVNNSIVAYHDEEKPKPEMTPAPTFEIFCEQANNLSKENIDAKGATLSGKTNIDIFQDEATDDAVIQKNSDISTSKPSTFKIFQESPPADESKSSISAVNACERIPFSLRTETKTKKEDAVDHTENNDHSRDESEKPQPSDKNSAIFNDDKKHEAKHDDINSEVVKADEVMVKSKAFQIYNEQLDERVHQGPEEPCATLTDSQTRGDDKSVCSQSSAEQGGGDTATFSIFGEAMNALNDISQSANGEEEKTKDNFHQDLDDEVLDADKEIVHDSEHEREYDTATFSLFGEAMDALNDISQSERKHRPSELSDVSSIGGINTSLNNSRIDPICDSETASIDKTTSKEALEIQNSRDEMYSPLTKLSKKITGIEYQSVHRDDIKAANRQMYLEASRAGQGMPFAGPETDLSLTLSKKGNIVDLSNQPMPRGLKRKATALGEEIRVGKRSAVVKQELGKGSYGIVVLIDSPEQGEIAVKAQMPTDCLAWEFVLMKRLEERIGNDKNKPFPSPLSFVTLSDGGLLSMSAVSRTGMNLVDICNVYQLKEGAPVPELIALHYTCRMLKHIELLHWRGKILHCDVKPDNWVLTASDCSYEGCTELIEASDLMLVDFGRAVDLAAAADDSMNPIDLKLKGLATSEDMACVANRLNLEWSFDVDTFGICASAHVLLYGSHIEISMDGKKRWNIKKPLRRYWQKELWSELFETLLNLDDVTRIAIGSRPKSLREIRRKFELFLSEKSKELESLLKHQYRILPKRRLE